MPMVKDNIVGWHWQMPELTPEQKKDNDRRNALDGIIKAEYWAFQHYLPGHDSLDEYNNLQMEQAYLHVKLAGQGVLPWISPWMESFSRDNNIPIPAEIQEKLSA
jgi:hypothetical protein